MLALLPALGLGDPARTQVVIEEGQTFTIINSSQYRGQSFIINSGGILINNDIGTEIGGVDLKFGGMLNLQQALQIGVDAGFSAGLSTLAGTVTSIDGANLIVDDNASITGANAGLVSAVLIRNGAQLTLSAPGAIGAPADFDFGPVQVETASGLVIDADNAIDVNPEIRFEDTARLTLNANQTVVNLYSADLSAIDLADGKTLTINTTGTIAESDLLFSNMVGQGNLVFAGDGFLYMIPDMDCAECG